METRRQPIVISLRLEPMDLYVARQPIFTARNELAGYELLYRNSASAVTANPADANRMSSDVIVQNFLEAGVARLTSGKKGFINFTREMLLKEVYRLFDPGAIVIELTEDIPADDEVIAACRKMTGAGYTLALDDFVIGGIQERLLPDAHIVKVDLLNRSSMDVKRIAGHLRPFFVKMLAERVETAEIAWAAEKEGFTLFQGYYFSRPETIGHRSTAVESLRLLPLLNMVQNVDTPNREIERIFRSDPALSYKLLQIANSATRGLFGVESIHHALQLVGRDVLHRWLSLLMASSLAASAEHAPELLKSTLHRARFMELIGNGRTDGGSLFLVGLFSNMDALLGMTLSELLAKVRFSDEVRGALQRHDWSRYLAWLQLSEAYEEGDWPTVAQLSEEVVAPVDRMPLLYMKALEWAMEMLETVSSQKVEAA